MTIRGGGHPKQAMVLKPVSRMGPPPRSFAADAHDCIMVRSLRTYRIQGCGAMIAPDGKLPSDYRPDHNQRGRRARVCQGTAWKRRSVRPGQSDGRPCQALCASASTRVGRGEETGFQVEQRNWNGGSGEWCKIYA